MPHSFVTAIEWLSLSQKAEHGSSPYQGKIARCHYELTAYHDGLFAELDVVFPPQLERAVPKRRAEFLAGRYVASAVLQSLNYPRFILKNGEDRAPLWPENIRGTLSHNRNTALCAAHVSESALGCHGVGIDIESLMDESQARELMPMIVNQSEQVLFERHNQSSLSLLLTLTFSAKESLFKMLYPQVGYLFGFLDAQMVMINEEQRYFILELCTDLSVELRTGMRFQGIYRLSSQDITTFIYS